MKTKTVLLIDDSKIDIFIHRKLLEHCGVTNIQTCESSEQALEYLHGATEQPDLILVDVVMQFENGFEFIDSYRKSGLSNGNTRIVVVSCSLQECDKEAAYERTVEYIIKPLTIEKTLLLL